MSDDRDDYSFDSNSFDNEDLGVDNVDDDVVFRYDDSDDYDDDGGDEPVTIVEDISKSLKVHTPQNYEFSGASEVVDGAVTVMHLDDEGNQHSQVIDLASPELSRDEAEKLTKTIQTQSNVLYLLIARAHAGKAHIALGYTSFEAYIRAEFDYSKSYAYKLINQANIINTIAEVMPAGTQVYVSDATARGLKSSMDDFIPELESRLASQPDEDPSEIMDELVQKYRESRDAPREDESELGDDYDENGGDFGGGGGNGEYSGNGEYRGGNDEDESGFDGDYDTENYDEEADEDAFDGEDGQTVRRRYEAVYNLYTALSQFTQMPSNEDIIKTIPPERRPQVTAYLETAVTWLQNFREEWVREIVEAEETTDYDENDDDETSDDESDHSEEYGNDENN